MVPAPYLTPHHRHTPKWGWPHAPRTDLMPGTHAHPSNHTTLFLVTPTLTGPAPFDSWASSSLLQGTSTPPLPQHISCSELCEDRHPPLWPPTCALPGVVSLPRCSHTLRATYLPDLHLQRLTNPLTDMPNLPSICAHTCTCIHSSRPAEAPLCLAPHLISPDGPPGPPPQAGAHTSAPSTQPFTNIL